jgi:hypothetical protein
VVVVAAATVEQLVRVRLEQQTKAAVAAVVEAKAQALLAATAVQVTLKLLTGHKEINHG